MTNSKNKKVVAYGYIKEEDGIYTAICVNMGLFGQGKTPDSALNKVINAVLDYVEYIHKEHPDECEKYLNRPAPYEFVREYKRGIDNLKKLAETKNCTPRQPHTFIPIRNFAEKISFAQTQRSN